MGMLFTVDVPTYIYTKSERLQHDIYLVSFNFFSLRCISLKKRKENNLDLNPLSQAVSIYLIIYVILLFYTLVIYTIGYSYKK